MTMWRDLETGLTPSEIADELTYINYAHNRRLSPHISPERWEKVYPNAQALEARFQEESK